MKPSCKEPITVVRYTSSLQAVWDGFVAGCKNATFLFERGYIDYNPRFTDHSLLFYKGSELVALLPACISGDVLASHAGLTYGGLLYACNVGAQLVLDIFDALFAHLRQNTSVKKVVYRPVPHIYATYPAEEDLYALYRCNAVLAGRRVSSVVWQPRALPFSTLRKRKVKRATGCGLTIHEDCNYAAFWAVLAENLQKEHTAVPVHSLAEIELLAGRFPQNIKLYRVVDAAGNTVAGTVLYITERVVRVQYIGSVQAGRDAGAVDLLFHHLVHTCYAHKEFFDFGTSVEQGGLVLNCGLIFQKEGFGGRAVVYDSYEVDVSKALL